MVRHQGCGPEWRTPSPPAVEMMVALLFPVGSGELRLTSRDPQAQPFLDYNYLADSFDRNACEQACG